LGSSVGCVRVGEGLHSRYVTSFRMLYLDQIKRPKVGKDGSRPQVALATTFAGPPHVVLNESANRPVNRG
jgi:hypothetical protein